MSDDYAFLKTGSSNIIDNTPDDDLILTVTAIVSSFVENSLKTAEVYMNHAKRTVITKEDMKLCLMYETFLYLNKKDTPENIMRWKGLINDFPDDSDSDEDYVCIDDLNAHQFTISKCKCKTCVDINSIENYWSKWNPDEGIESILKNAIESHFI